MPLSSHFPSLGFGVGFRTPHYRHVLDHRPATIDWLEVITENFMNVGGRPRQILTEVREHYPVVLHGVGLSIGSPEPIARVYLDQLKELVHWLKPAMISDHLCFTSYGQHNSHDLLPIPYTRTLLDRITDKLHHIQDQLGRRIMLENPSAYASYGYNDMGEAEFFANLCERTGCGILLDLNNLFVNQSNLGLDPHHYLNTIPHHAVGQFHLAGHSIADVVRIDTHDHPVTEEVWELYRFAAKKWPQVSTLLEWDDNIPQFEDLVAELDKARQAHAAGADVSTPMSVATNYHSKQSSDDAQKIFFAMATDPGGLDEVDPRISILDQCLPVPALRGIQVYHNAYFARLREVLGNVFPTLLGVTSEDGFSAICATYLVEHPPHSSNIDCVGVALPQFLLSNEIPGYDFGVSQRALHDISLWDLTDHELFSAADLRLPLSRHVITELTEDLWNHVGFEFHHTLRTLSLEYAVESVVTALATEEQPSPPANEPTSYLFWRHNCRIQYRKLDFNEGFLLSALRGGKTFYQACQLLAAHMHVAEDAVISQCVPLLVRWFDDGMISGMNIEKSLGTP